MSINTCALNIGAISGSAGAGWIMDPSAIYVADPIFSLVQGQYPSSYLIHIGCPDPSAKIYYTTDGSTPSSSSNLYTEPILVFTGKLKAIAVGYEAENE